MVTILTPTFNRMTTLTALYNSLLNQTSNSFQWLVIDDGSTDDTERMIGSFINENRISIVYKKKKNGGKHTALNYSHPYIEGDLLWIVDSDDTVVPNAVETIEKDWERFKRNERIVGLTYLKGSDNNHPLRNYTRDKDEFISDYVESHVNLRGVPDECEIITSNAFREVMFPEFEGEKFLGESYMWNKLGCKYKTVYINKVLYICSYLEDGLTKSGRSLRIACPLGGMENEKTYFNNKFCFKQRVKHSILYNCYGFFAGYSPWEIINSSKNLYTFFFIPFGFVLYLIWKRKYQ